ncbi:hypothetical protein [Sphingomonas sp.]|uniref:hypothetical protein n=1 Tax=Sphingomonas sp. TaxID=28214 RepID=UPI001B0023E7|nr:hypothetical protein [Sphingomonas sp.]MBO9712186.1 hypothetical protein [Sphingomonas sp.]
MRRLTALFLALALCLSLFAASASHAVEQLGCVDAASAVEAGHFDGDKDEVPADADKGYPHHHGVCHGHHVAAETDSGSPLWHDDVREQPVPARIRGLAFATADPALRPPQA